MASRFARRVAPWGAFAALFTAWSADAAPTFAGSVRLSHFSSSRDLDDVQGIQALTLEAGLKQDLSDSQRIELKGRATRFGHGKLAHTRTHWSELLWRGRFEHLDLRLGQQKVRWGKADGINPTDFFTPQDYTSLLPLEDDRHLSVAALRADLHLGDEDAVSIVAATGFTPSRIPWPKPSPVEVTNDEPGGGQFGARWTHTGSHLDWSMSGFNGYATLPLLHYAPDGAGQARFIRHYAPIRGLGADLAGSLGKFGVRAELAHVAPMQEDGRQSFRSNYHLVAGIDRALGEWNLNLQAIVRHTPGYRPPDPQLAPPAQWAARQNDLVHGQQARWMHGMTARIAADWRNDTVQTELLFVQYFSPDTYLLRPLLTYAASDRIRLRAGAELYSGPAHSYFGALERNRTAFIELQAYY